MSQNQIMVDYVELKEVIVEMKDKANKNKIVHRIKVNLESAQNKLNEVQTKHDIEKYNMATKYQINDHFIDLLLTETDNSAYNELSVNFNRIWTKNRSIAVAERAAAADKAEQDQIQADELKAYPKHKVNKYFYDKIYRF